MVVSNFMWIQQSENAIFFTVLILKIMRTPISVKKELGNLLR